jgi:proline dehydrogenase
MSFFDRLIVGTLPLVPKFIVGRVAARYVAGQTLDEAVALIRKLNGEGAMATVDLLGEEVRDHAKATEAVTEYLRILERIEKEKLDANISVKPTQIGLGFDENFCRDNYDQLAAAAKVRNNFMRLDMEDRTTTDATLKIYRYCHERHGNVGPVLQAYMRRTLRDIAELPADCVSVRICKGIYVEPREAAFKAYETVRLNYLQCLEALLKRGIYVGIATHDEHLVCGALGILDRLGVPRDRYEFQMLLGVDNQLRKILIGGGHRLRVYVPYGRDWYHYSMRRLRENPQVAGHVARALLRGE